MKSMKEDDLKIFPLSFLTIDDFIGISRTYFLPFIYLSYDIIL